MKFFISSTYQDLKKIRRVAINTVESITQRKTGVISAMEEFPASQKSIDAFCVKQVEDADIVIGIYGYRFGSKGIDGRSMTEIEFDKAAERGTTILAFIATDAETQAEPDQQRFIKNKVHQLGGLCAMFNPDDLRKFAEVLNASLKEYLGTLEGYSYCSVWDDINELRDKISEEDDVPRLIPYGENEEEKALQDIQECAENLLDFGDDLSAVNEAVYNWSYNIYHELGTPEENEAEKTQALKELSKHSDAVMRNWENLNLGLSNFTTRILLAVNYLKLCNVQKRLLNEQWTEDLRQEVIQIRDFYVEQINTRSTLSD